MLEPPTGKSSLRSELRERRVALSATKRQRAAVAASLHAREIPGWATARNIALYIAADGEVDTAPLAALCRRAGAQLFLPVMQAGKSLAFAHWHPASRLVQNSYGIAEPPADAARIEVAELDIIFLPLVGWDREGGRLGMGGGYYDRTLEGKRGPLLVGLAYSVQEVSRIPREDWDVPLDCVLTELGVQICAAHRHD